jgi:hypothetical protein
VPGVADPSDADTAEVFEMRNVLIVSTLLAVVAAPAAADVAANLVAPYLRIQVALADDALATVKADAALIAAEADTLGEAGKPLKAAATEVGGAADLNAARAAFGRLSDALVKFAEGSHPPLGADLNVAYCPMVKKSWVQKGTPIVNPYGGKQMRSCGEIVKPVR